MIMKHNANNLYGVVFMYTLAYE